jgi:glycosyltransferase involved in cell wall biosynthesis
MKILLVQPAVSPSKGGAQWNTVRLAVGLADRGHEVRLVGDFHAVPEMSRMLNEARISIATIRIHARGFRPILSLISDVRNFKPDVIHSCLRSGDVAAGIAAFVLRKPVVSTVGEKLPTDNDMRNGIGWKGRVHKLLLRRVFKSIGATSNYAKEHLISYSDADNSKIQIIPNGVDFDEFSQPSSAAAEQLEFEKPSGKFILGVVGRIAPEKQVELLPELIELLVDKGIEAEGLIVGEGISESQVRKDVNGSVMRERIKFLGNRADMAHIYRKFSMLVHFGSIEGFGLVIAEAMACGIPVIAANAGGAVELITDGEDGFLVTPGSIEQYAEKIAALANHQSEYQQIAVNAQTKIKKDFSIDRFVDRYESLYENVVGGRSV